MDIKRIINNTIKDENNCWLWKRSCNSAGYGQLTEDKVYWLAHRYSYACIYDDLDNFEVIRHKCNNPKCCNPDHLVGGSNKENWYDSLNNHKKASDSRRKSWVIDGVSYLTIREARSKTGLCMNTLVKYTEDGIFNSDNYRGSCKIIGCKPKI